MTASGEEKPAAPEEAAPDFFPGTGAERGPVISGSSSGITEGGRTGLTACVTGVLFLVSLVLSPLFLTIPSFATAPALIVVGFLMMQQVAHINWQDITEAIPCFAAITMMGFAYSISDGISFGIITYVVLHLLTGKTKDMSPLMYILAVLFVLKYIVI